MEKDRKMSSNPGNRLASQFTVAIIGGGFAGTTLAAQLLRKSGQTVSVVLIERSGQLGRGVAYGTQCAEHLLNVPAQKMTAYPDEPDHFLHWARHNFDPGVKTGDYLPRRVYGRYVASVLQQEIDRHPGRFIHAQDEAVSLARVGGTTEITLRSGQVVFANKVVLALGNFPPGDPRLPGKTPHSQRYVSNPWAASKPSDSAQDESVLLVGSGLTSVDIAISLRARGFGGTIHILSRRGLLPQSHQATAPWPAFWDENSPKNIRGLMRLIRAQARAAEQQGISWRAVIDSIRPFSHAIWRSLPRQEQRRFLRHVRPYWEVHRHRIANQIHNQLTAQRERGQIEIHAGRITQYVEDPAGVEVTYRDRESGALKRLRVHRVINCTGPEADCRRIENLLLANLLRHKMVRPDPLFLGLDTSEEGALTNAHGEASEFLYTLGPSRRGSLWETTAVPEIRVQASQLAVHLVAAIKADSGLPAARMSPQHSAIGLAVPSSAAAGRFANRPTNSSEVA